MSRARCGSVRAGAVLGMTVALGCAAILGCSESPDPRPASDARGEGGGTMDGALLDGSADGSFLEGGPALDGAGDGRAPLDSGKSGGDSGKPAADGALPASGLWSAPYYAGWMQGYLPPSQIDYGALTHLIHFALVPNTDGTLDEQSNGVSAAKAQVAVQAAHAAGKKILICVGGASSRTGFVGASGSANRAAFIAKLVALMSARSYDGIDVDWEPLQSADSAQYVALVSELRAALSKAKPGALLTAAVGSGEAPIIAKAASALDQIHVMTYDMSGAWPGWLTWHNAPVYSGGCKFQSTGQSVPSADSMLQSYISAGIAPKKLGIGIDFYGYIWSGGSGTTTGGATKPCQTYVTAPSVSAVSYYTIMAQHYQATHYKWDSGAQAAYLGVDNAGSASDTFISYDNEISIAAKAQYAKSKGLGGVFVWELGGGYRPTMPIGQRDLLLQALKKAIAAP